MKRDSLFHILYPGLLIILFVLPFNGISQQKKLNLDVNTLIQLTSRQVEQLDTFYVTGKVGGSVNAGFVNCFKLLGSDENYVLITSQKNSLPDQNKMVTLKVVLYSELRVNKKSRIVLSELKR